MGRVNSECRRSAGGAQAERRRSAGGAQAVRLVLLCSTGDPCPAEDIKYLTRKALRQHWGSNMDNFPSAHRPILCSSGVAGLTNAVCARWRLSRVLAPQPWCAIHWHGRLC